MMAPVQSSAKALSRILGRRFSSVLVSKSSGERSRGPERRVSTPWFNVAAQIGNPFSRVLGDGGRCRGSSIGSLPCSAQSRWFLGVGDGEEGDVLCRSHEERVVMGYTQEQLFNVVAAVDLYEDFLPWCQRSRIIRRNNDGSFDAELEIGFKFLVESYVSHVELRKPTYIKTTALDTGLFDHLINIWEFNPGPVPGTCDLHFLVDFKFQSPLYRQVLSVA
ncbi:coenzyme Q-binding protein COQ10 homolog A, mitochondrial [Phalaenopsis equestris]|uniref:coenzyme Q-binding protein COQ10 homolog A, mitochondrial n=1 Tax=Phalaenopsis equestris TaxID=78828 RepID=UPI0009E2A97C|nr:coenzyme Q-binding protein COQ10 homolog A, mitochondrial [Phalaenopsis equestris]